MRRYLATVAFLSLTSLTSSVVWAATPTSSVILGEIENPDPKTFATFGATLEVIGDNLAVGALGDKNGPFYEGAVYQFANLAPGSSQLVREYRRPQLQDADRFGHALASSGQLLAIADPRYIIGPTERAGAVHIYDSSNGQYLRSIPNPTPAYLDVFGWDVAASGATLAISELSETANDAKAYLYDVNTGALTRTLTKPVGATDFGTALAATDSQVFVGGRMGAVGAVFSFDIASGAHVRTFLDPTSAPFNVLSTELVTIGDKLIIGGMSEEAYVFEIATGQLLKTITSPGPSDPEFSTVLAPYGDDLLISAHHASQAHLVDLESGDVLLTLDVPQASDFPASIGAYLSLAELNGRILMGHPAWSDSPGPSDEGRVFLMRGIPEPSTASLIAVGLAAATACRRCRRVAAWSGFQEKGSF